MEITKEFAELIGIISGDGRLSSRKQKYVIYICGHKIDDKEYHETVIVKLFLDVFGKIVKIQERRKENAIFIRFADKVIFEILKSIGLPVGKKYDTLRIPNQIITNTELSIAYVRGFFDTDGCVVFSKQHRNYHYYPRLEIASKSRKILEDIFMVLTDLGFYGSISSKGIHFRLEIPGFRNLDLWMKIIGFNNPKHRNKIIDYKNASGQTTGNVNSITPLSN